ncbi:MspA family porin [Nocardia terpenica]|uniref:MspA family porin n=1 Tax=Nocardia terpenica TaxID=455432 RepID=UPI001893CA09|nr:MspA family porin [Nocardia terpenica]MBF6064266.1 MspA family porin [Nocardia terpenica]MBF6106599.1 MspA family porin [Nocardia terpenica]MBF6113884.1 MspA family porin [Nocardia terpenica]MBF6120492.1 MspA family porin [Nocardia terpenica]MBF6154851.1 MspA family porin [Nocardia terpenica]
MSENIRRAAAMVGAVVLGVITSGAAASAAVDSTNSIQDHGRRTIEAMSENTRIDFVPPLDGSPLTREWFHSGKAGFEISGPGAGDWHGHITIGYMVGFPAALSGKIKFQYDTPGLELQLSAPSTLDVFDLIPRLGIELEVGPGPGIQTVEAAGGDISGAEGFIQMSGFHGTVTGVIGPTTIRPFVKVVSADGDTVVSYGPLSQN